MFNSLLALDTSVIMYIVIGVVLVLMVVLTIIPQKKRQKAQQNMMNSLTVGTKIMTIGRMVGKITQVNPDNTLIVNVGTVDNPTLIVIDRQAVGLVLENVAGATPVASVEEKKSKKKHDKEDNEYDPMTDTINAPTEDAKDATSVDEIAPSATSDDIFQDDKK